MSVINAFIDPPPMSSPGDYSFAYTFPYGSQHEFKWKDNYSTPLNLLLMQETTFVDNNTLSLQYDTLASDLTETKTYTWLGRPSQNLSISNVFWLGIYNASNEKVGPLFESQYFNVTTASSSSSSSSSSSLSSSLISSSTSASTNHVALRAGLGAGLGGAAILPAIALFFFFRSRKPHGKGGKTGRTEVYQLTENDTIFE